MTRRARLRGRGVAYRSIATASLMATCLLVGVSCSKDPKPARIEQTVTPANPAREQEPSEEEESEDPPAKVAASATAATDTLPAGTVDPSRIPVEEDFVHEAEARISKNANLEAELARIEREIEGSPAGSEKPGSKSEKK